jgi:hypothetical protein
MHISTVSIDRSVRSDRPSYVRHHVHTEQYYYYYCDIDLSSVHRRSRNTNAGALFMLLSLVFGRDAKYEYAYFPPPEHPSILKSDDLSFKSNLFS